MFDIVKHIIDVKVAERDEAKAALEKKQQKQKILDIISRKEDENLQNMPLEELKKLLVE